MHYYTFTALIYGDDKSRTTFNLLHKSEPPSHIPEFMKEAQDCISAQSHTCRAIVISYWQEVFQTTYDKIKFLLTIPSQNIL